MPNTWDEWRDVANERMSDATVMLPARSGSVGPVYMAGYAIECSLKALLQQRGSGFPTTGAEGHHLRSLWKSAGFATRDVGERADHATYYIEHWSTDLRYEVAGDFPGACDVMLAGAKRLVGFLQTRLRREAGRRRR